MLLTIYIPTFNRAKRLEKSIADVFREIKSSNLETSISVLVGDNCSPDATFQVCAEAKEIALIEEIDFSYFKNVRNLGFSGNISSGLERVKSDWIMFLSDDDNLYQGALANVCQDITEKSPSIALYNFAQPPYDVTNPLITKNIYSIQNVDYLQLTSLVIWPKLTGIVFRVQPIIGKSMQIQEICAYSKHFPHVILSAYILSQAPGLLTSKIFLGRPDDDFLDHVNFVPYIGEYLISEFTSYIDHFDSKNESLKQLVAQIPRTSILDVSVSSLIGYYRGHTKMTKKVKARLESNLSRWIFGKSRTSDGLLFLKPSKYFFFKLLLVPFFALAAALRYHLSGQKLQLMEDGF